MTWFLEVLKSSELRGGKWKNLCISIFGLKCVAKICRRMTKDLYFISDCYPYLAKSSYGWLPLWLQTKIPIKTTPGKTNLQSKIPIHCFFFFYVWKYERYMMSYTLDARTHEQNRLFTCKELCWHNRQMTTNTHASTLHPRPCDYGATSLWWSPKHPSMFDQHTIHHPNSVESTNSPKTSHYIINVYLINIPISNEW